MVDVGCYPPSRIHAEMRTNERVLGAARAFQEDMDFNEAKSRVLEAIQTCELVEYLEEDSESGLPKYKVKTRLPGSKNIWVILYIIEDKEKDRRMLKSVYTNFEEMSPEWNRK